MNGSQLGLSLGLRIAQLGSKVRETSLAKTTPALAQQAAKVVDRMAEERARRFEAQVIQWLETHASTSPLPAAITGLFGAIGRAGGFMFQQVLSTAIGFGVGGALSAVLEPYFYEMVVAAWESNPVQRLGPQQAAQLHRMGVLTEAQGAAEAVGSGVDGQRFNWMVELTRSFIPASETIALLNRGKIDRTAARDQLMAQGLAGEDADRVLELREFLPPPTDLIRFAVREVFTPDIAQQFGLDQDFPPQFGELARLLGITEEVAHWYWMGHWDLPSPGQGFTMLHRGVIDQPTLERLLRALDVMPFWRDKLVDIAYLVPGRIDLRRMFKAGTIDRARVLRGYLDIGYAPDVAELLTQFAVDEKHEAERELTKAEVLTFYREREIDAAVATDILGSLGYEEDEASFLLALEDSKRARAYRDRAISAVRSRYVGRKLTEDQAHDAMARLGVPSAEIQDLLTLWDIERDATTADMTTADMRALLRRGVIDAGRFMDEMIRRGYSDEEAEWQAILAVPASAQGGA